MEIKKKLMIIIIFCIVLIICNKLGRIVRQEVSTDESIFNSDPEMIKTGIYAISNSQQQIESTILSEYAADLYDLQHPLLIQDPYGVAPLTALLMFNTQQKASVTVKIPGKTDFTSIEYIIPGEVMHHEIPILGLYPNTDNIVTISVLSNDQTTTKEINIRTEALPADFPEIELIVSQPEKMQPGFTFANQAMRQYNFIYDSNADVRWYYTRSSSHVFNQLPNGNFIITDDEVHPMGIAVGRLRLQEINPLGKIVNSYYISNGIHHDAIILPNGNYLITSKNDSFYIEDTMYEIDYKTGEIVNTICLRDILPESFFRWNDGEKPTYFDWAHQNSIWYDEVDNTIIISMRFQSIVMKLGYPDASIKWIMASREGFPDEFENKLLLPISPDFKFQTSQHAAMKLLNQDDNPNTLDLVLFDNNMGEARGDQNMKNQFSQGMHVRINEKNFTVEEIWSYGKEHGLDLYSSGGCDANYDSETGNYLLTFSYIENLITDGGYSSVIETDSLNNIVFRVDFHNSYTFVYRSERYSLYPDGYIYQLINTPINIFNEEQHYITVED